MALINGDTPKKVYAGLQGLVSIVARYEYEMEEERNPLHELVTNVFPVLGSLVNNFLANKENPDAQHLIHLIAKVFYKANHL
jgi:hypothetical protein